MRIVSATLRSPSAVAEAMLMALTVTRRLGRIVVAGTVHPEYRQILATFLANALRDPDVMTREGTRLLGWLDSLKAPDRSP